MVFSALTPCVGLYLRKSWSRLPPRSIAGLCRMPSYVGGLPATLASRHPAKQINSRVWPSYSYYLARLHAIGASAIESSCDLFRGLDYRLVILALNQEGDELRLIFIESLQLILILKILCHSYRV
jgi:hypothetical protein